jgi:hypothetical protein
MNQALYAHMNNKRKKKVLQGIFSEKSIHRTTYVECFCIGNRKEEGKKVKEKGMTVCVCVCVYTVCMMGETLEM